MSTEGQRTSLFTVNYIFALKQIQSEDAILSAAILELRRVIGGWTLKLCAPMPAIRNLHQRFHGSGSCAHPPEPRNNSDMV